MLVHFVLVESPLRPRQDSNLRSRLRRAVLYPLSYGGQRSGAAWKASKDLPRVRCRGLRAGYAGEAHWRPRLEFASQPPRLRWHSSPL